MGMKVRFSWRGTHTIPHAGDYWLYLQALGNDAKFFIDRKPMGDTGTVQGANHGDSFQVSQNNVVPTIDGPENVRCSVDLIAGPLAIDIHIRPDTSNEPAQIRLNWYTREQRVADHAAAISAAKKAKLAVVFLWARQKPVFGLSRDQNKLVDKVAAVNPNTIVVLNTSQPVARKRCLRMGWKRV